MNPTSTLRPSPYASIVVSEQFRHAMSIQAVFVCAQQAHHQGPDQIPVGDDDVVRWVSREREPSIEDLVDLLAHPRNRGRVDVGERRVGLPAPRNRRNTLAEERAFLHRVSRELAADGFCGLSCPEEIARANADDREPGKSSCGSACLTAPEVC